MPTNMSLCSLFPKKSLRRQRRFDLANKGLIALAQTVMLALPVMAQQAPRATAPTIPTAQAPAKFSLLSTNPRSSALSQNVTASAPTVPSAASIITPSVASNLAAIVNGALVINVGNLPNGVYHVTGNFLNTNNLTFVSTNSNVHSATLSVTGSIFNPVGASISTLIPTGYSNAVTNLNLALIAQAGIFNAGSIVSAGSLSMTAPVIANIHPSSIGASGAAPVMQAMTGNLTMQTSTLLNQGTIAAAMGNVNVANLTNSLAINALGGTFNASNGVINIGTQNLTDQLNLQMLGGDFISQALNLTA